MTLSSLLTWFYCLDFREIFQLLILAVLVYLWIFPQVLYPVLFRRVNFIFLCCSIGLILVSTLGGRQGLDVSPALLPFHSYREAIETGNIELYRSNLMNALLFFPFGLTWATALSRTRRKPIPGILIAIALSVGIELCQYAFLLGRPEIDDVIHNVLGAIVGIGIGYLAKTFHLENET